MFNMRILLKGAVLIDGTGAAPVHGSGVLIDGDRIKAVGHDADFGAPEPGTRVVDADGKYLLPGFINVHEHVTMKRTKKPLKEQMQTPVEQLVALGIRSALLDLKEGITTIRDLTSKGGISRVVKAALDGGTVVGPNMVACPQAFTVTGGYGSLFGIEVDSPEEARKAARALVKAGCDWVKCFASIEWERGDGEPISAVNMAPELIQEIYAVAHHHGKPCTAHAIHDQAIRNAVEAGADCIEHGIMLSEATAALMATRGTHLVPTLSGYWEHCNPAWGRGEGVVRHGLMLHEHHGQAFRNAVQAGVKIAYGSDTLGNLVDEVRIMQENGFTPMDCVLAATRNGADVLGMADHVGTITPGKLADFVLLGSDPLVNHAAFGDVLPI
jgi:imidazolonepropionase-like amidohydrolase